MRRAHAPDHVRSSSPLPDTAEFRDGPPDRIRPLPERLDRQASPQRHATLPGLVQCTIQHREPDRSGGSASASGEEIQQPARIFRRRALRLEREEAQEGGSGIVGVSQREAASPSLKCGHGLSRWSAYDRWARAN